MVVANPAVSPEHKVCGTFLRYPRNSAMARIWPIQFGKLLLNFAEDNKLALLNTFFCVLKGDAPYTF